MTEPSGRKVRHDCEVTLSLRLAKRWLGGPRRNTVTGAPEAETTSFVAFLVLAALFCGAPMALAADGVPLEPHERPARGVSPDAAAMGISTFAPSSSPRSPEASTWASSGARPRVAATETTPVYGYRVVARYRHDPKAYTQGLVYYEGILYESTGLRGISTLREVALETGRILRKHSLDPQYFAEGLALWNDQLSQLTYTSGIGFVYDRATFRVLKTWAYEGEGWGLAADGQQLLMSDGTEWIRRLNPDTFEETGRFAVTDQGVPVTRLNELEYIGGLLYANVYMTDRIAIIDPSTGEVESWLDLTGLLSEDEAAAWSGVLNGIAYDAGQGRLLVTGKGWTRLYHIEMVDASGSPVLPGR